MDVHDRIDLERLVRFAVVAEELSFSRAAKRLNLDQPLISRQIRQLECKFGFPLFSRNTRRVCLTTEGEALLQYARQVVELSERTQRAVEDLNRLHRGQVALGVNVASFWLPARREIVSAFNARYPSGRLKVESHYSPRLAAQLRKRAIDLALLPAAYDCPDAETLLIHRSWPSLLVPKEHPLAGRGCIEMGEVSGQRILTPSPKILPRVYGQHYGPFFEAGAIPVIVPEGDVAISYYALHNREIMVAMGWPNSESGLPHGFVHVPITSGVHHIDFVLARRAETASGLLLDFWKTAEQVAAKLLARQCSPAELAVANTNVPFIEAGQHRAAGHVGHAI